MRDDRVAQGHQQSAMRSVSIVAARVSQSFALATQAAREASTRSRCARSVVEMPKRSRSGITTGCSVISVCTVTLQEMGRGYWVMRVVYALHRGIKSRGDACMKSPVRLWRVALRALDVREDKPLDDLSLIHISEPT